MPDPEKELTATEKMQAEIADLLDKEMYKVLTQGEEIVISGPEGPVHEIKRPGHSMLAAIARRVRDLKILSKVEPDSAAGKLLKAATRNLKKAATGPKLVSEDDDGEREEVA